MKNNIYLHIGSPKTGTTSIQNTFFHNRSRLNDLGFHFPGSHANHHFSFLFTKAVYEDWPRQFKSIKKGELKSTFEQYFQHLAQDINGSQKDRHIISTEYLFIDNVKYIENYLSFLNTFYNEIKVCLFLRNPIDYFRSAQQQMIKARSYLTNPEKWILNFKSVIGVWSNFAEIDVIEYKTGLDSCELFCNWAGIDYSNLKPLKQQSNTSLSVEQMLLLEKIQSQLYTNHEDRFKGHLEVLHQIKSTDLHNPRLKEEIRTKIYQNHIQDLFWLKENHNINFLNKELDTVSEKNLPELGEKASVRDIFKIPDETIVEKYEAQVMDLLLKKVVQQTR